jgi:hypothetical protein
MIWEKDIAEFNKKLANIFVSYASNSDFLNYFKTNYLDGDKFIQWFAAFQFQISTNVEKNNFVKSWHNQLKSTYLDGKKNRRADHLVYILVNDIESDFIQNTKRIQLNIGRMGPEERRRRTEMNAEAVNETVIVLMIRELKGDHSNIIGFAVASFTTEEVFHHVEVLYEEMKSCSCQDFCWNHIACKHMNVLKRAKRNILLFTDTINLPALEMHTSIVPETLENNPNENMQTTTNLNGIEVFNNLRTIINASKDDCKNNPHHLTYNQIEALINLEAHLVKIFSHFFLFLRTAYSEAKSRTVGKELHHTTLRRINSPSFTFFLMFYSPITNIAT